jgi:V/A-type H+-transporting ATPase subunit I
MLHQAVFLQSRPPLPEERAQVPSATHHPRWLHPFVTLVSNYGVPRYGEFDPTLLFALSYVAMFGMMFGDVGHGLIIALAAPLLRRRMPRITPFVVLCGLSSMLFGWLYGSIFGYEHVITPLWQSPLSDPILMLKVAMLAGIGFILLATLISIRNNLIEGDLRSALLEGNGVAGLAMYLSLLWLAWRTVEQQSVWPAATLLCLSLATLMGYNYWKNRAAPLVERLLILLVEAFETVMNYVSGTLSYLRLAAFSLNHVALAIAVFTLAHMLETTGYVITVILGNVFILVLEGAIVMIQALRLEYYEGFSRFYRGDGREFHPLRLDHNTS